MTLQTREIFYYQGEELFSHNQPLDQHPKLPKFQALGSFCWRGYRGIWSIHDKKLYLVDLYAHIPKIEAIPNYLYIKYDRKHKDLYYEIHLKISYKKAYIEDVFSKIKDGKVFASWFTGPVNFGLGNVTDHGMTYLYKNYLSLNFENGRLIKELIRPHNKIYPAKNVKK